MRSDCDASQVGPNPDGDTCRPRSRSESTARIFKFEACFVGKYPDRVES